MREGILNGVLLTVLLGLLLYHVDAPWRYIHEDNGAFFHAIASAHLLAGWQATAGHDHLVLVESGALVPYLHHPPLLANVLAASFALSGTSHPAAGRATMIVFHLTSFFLLVALARRVFPTEPIARRWASFVFAVAPMSAYFGKVVVHEVIALTFVLALAVAIAPRDGGAAPGRSARAFAAAAILLAGLSSWPAHFATLALVLWARSAALSIAWIVTFGAVVLHLAIAADGALGSQAQAARGWLSGGEGWGLVTTYLRALGKIFDFNRIYFGNAPTILLVGALAVRLASRPSSRRLGASGGTGFLPALALGQLAYVLLFPRAARVHAYHQMSWLPFMALASGLVVARIHGALAPRGPARARAAVAFVTAITLIASLGFLHTRYEKPAAYAVEASRRIESAYETWPRPSAPDGSAIVPAGAGNFPAPSGIHPVERQPERAGPTP